MDVPNVPYARGPPPLDTSAIQVCFNALLPPLAQRKSAQEFDRNGHRRFGLYWVRSNPNGTIGLE